MFDFDFGKQGNSNVAEQNDIIRRVLVGSKTGFLYQVNYETRNLEAVFKIHDQSVCSISISPGFCVTGSQDQYIRVWPLDFSEFFLEAKHEGAIISLDISMDGLSVACGTSNGSISVLDLSNQSYKTVVRSHCDDVVQLEYQSFSSYLISLSKDFTIRIWDSVNLEQKYEFTFSAEDECCNICAHPQLKQFAGGFHSGTFRIFDIESVEVLHESKFSGVPIECLQYSPSGDHFVVGDKKGVFTLLDPLNSYEFVKQFPSDNTTTKFSAAFSPDGRFLAFISTLNNTIDLYNLESLSKQYSISTVNSFIHTIFFPETKYPSEDKNTQNLSRYQLVALTCDSKIKCFDLKEKSATLRSQLGNLHQNFVADGVFTPNGKFLVSGGGDGCIKVWDGKMRQKTSCTFKGHSGAVFCVEAGICKEGGLKIYSAGGSEGIFEWEFDGDWRGYDFSGEEDFDTDDKNKTNLAVLPQNSILVHTFGDTVSKINLP